MASTREMRLRIGSIKNISQVTHALETISASKVRKAMQAVSTATPYSEKAWKVLVHLARQPGQAYLHPLLNERSEIKRIMVLMISGDRGLAGAYNVNILKNTLKHSLELNSPVSFIVVGKKGRELLIRRRLQVLAEFSNLSIPVSYLEVSPLGKLIIQEYLNGNFDQVYLSYTEFRSKAQQEIVFKKLLPLVITGEKDASEQSLTNNYQNSSPVYIYEPEQEKLLSEIIPRFTTVQIYQAILSSQASEQTARMLAMRNATENANELMGLLQLDYNKVRQQTITNDMLDISSGSEALSGKNG